MTNTSTQAAAPVPYGWILHPVIDTLFCCGGLVWVLFGLHYFLVGPQSEGLAAHSLAILGIVLTHLFSNAHTAATLVRVYQTPDIRRQFWLYTYCVPAACVLLAAAGFMVKGVAPVLVKIYLLWVIQHYTSQTYGIALIYCYKRGYLLNVFEKRLLWLLMYATAYFAILRQLTYPEWNTRYFVFQAIPFWGPLPAWIFQASTVVLAGSALAFAVVILRKWFIERKVMPTPVLLLLVTGVFIFVLGPEFSGTLWLYVPALYHGSQYLVVTTAYYLKARGLPDGVPPSQIASFLRQSVGLRYLGLVVLAGAFIYVGLPRLLEEIGFHYLTVFATIFAVFNFHHFLTDRAIWRLRDPRVRQILVR